MSQQPWYAGGAGVTNATKAELQARARKLLESEKYLAALEAALIDRTCPPAVETMLYHYAYGKPTETVQLNLSSDDLSQLSSQELLQKLATVQAQLAEAVALENALDITPH